MYFIIFFKNVLYYFFFETRARVSPGPDLDGPWTGLALIYEGQGQELLARPLRARARASKIR